MMMRLIPLRKKKRENVRKMLREHLPLMVSTFSSFHLEVAALDLYETTYERVEQRDLESIKSEHLKRIETDWYIYVSNVPAEANLVKHVTLNEQKQIDPGDTNRSDVDEFVSIQKFLRKEMCGIIGKEMYRTSSLNPNRKAFLPSKEMGSRVDWNRRSMPTRRLLLGHV